MRNFLLKTKLIIKSLSLTIIILLTSYIDSKGAELIIYNTYEDYIQKKGVLYDSEYWGWYHSVGKVTLIFKGKQKVKVKCKKVWGFAYKGVLFRNHMEYGQPTRLISGNKIHYYESGMAHLSMAHNNSTSGLFPVGYYCYFSKTLDGLIIPIPKQQSLSTATKPFKKFKEQNPQYTSLFDCIGKDYDYIKIRSCVEKFENIKITF